MKKIFTFLMVALFSATMFADNQYWIAGWNHKGDATVGELGNWDSDLHAMTVSEDGLYEYFALKAGDTNCKIYTASDWTGVMGNSYKIMGFNNTNIGNCIGGTWEDSGEEPTNINFWYNDGDYYVLVYKPGTAINATENPIVCASTFLPKGAASSYVVAGAEALCGSEWNPADVNNDMTKVSEGVYSITYAGVDLGVATYEFKVVKNHSWSCGSWPTGSDNYKLNITESGDYDVTITYTESTNAIEATAKLNEVIVVLPKINLGGAWYTDGEGNWLKGADFEEAVDKKTASTTINFPEGQTGYSFKVIEGGSWKGHAKESETKPLTFDRNNTSADAWGGDDAAYIWIDKAGDYTFTWTFESGTLSVGYPELVSYNVKISEPEHVGITVKDGETPIDGKVQELKELTVSAVAAVGYRVKNLHAYKFGDEATAVEIKDGKLTMPSFDIVIAVEEAEHLVDGYYLVGTFNGVSAWSIDDMSASKLFTINKDNDKEYMLMVDLKEGDYFKVRNVVNDAFVNYYPNEGGDYVVDADHAGNGKTIYFRPDGEGQGEGWHCGVIYIDANGGTTAIDNTAATVKAVKTLENGMLIIEKNGVRYNVLGQSIR